MDTPSLAIPRLRLSRHSQSPNNDDGSSPNTPLAGPSRLVELNSDDDDAHSTPRLSTIAALNSPADAGTPPLQSASVSSPASRLRSLLALAPKLRQSSPKRDDAPPSELDSDFDPPRFSPASSIAQESLKDIFSRALRDAGDTPQKGRPRRNSIDVSEVEGSPRVVRERAKHKGKRKSMSDEEGDKSASKFDPPSEASFRSSQATTFDILRERLANSRGKDSVNFCDTLALTLHLIHRQRPPAHPSVLSKCPHRCNLSLIYLTRIRR
ncbi:hypothetical protein PLICRDRAFT_473435 [Plicaturopsis crispa FD-325 SS-3]|nr:hypothetical protein PLICRDRAFT_473435 [Plicaturopsis crispa FD-325 SS-3]